MKKISTKKLVKGLIIASVLLFAISKFTASGGSKKVYEGHSGNYMWYDRLDGVGFDVPNGLRNAAFENGFFRPDAEYLTDTWVIVEDDAYKAFTYNDFVIFVSKGTNFMAHETASEAFRFESLENTWFTLDTSKKVEKIDNRQLDNGKSEVKRIANVVGDVSLNPQFFGSYVGRLASVSDGESEWSLFVGFKAPEYQELSAEQKDIACHVAASLVFYEAQHSEQPKEIEVTNTPELTPVPTEEASGEIVITSAPVTTGPPTVTATPEPTATPSPAPAIKAKDSSIDKPLRIGSVGWCNENLGGVSTETWVHPTEYLGKADAKEFLRDYFAEKKEEYPVPEEGTHWELVKYSGGLEIITCEMRGIDGERLVYGGVINSPRTHLITDKERYSAVEGYVDCYVYYAVPNGCDSYLLVFGNSDVGSAYYLIR